MSRLVASMIVRNELDRYLPLAVEHLRTYCDEIRVLDDNSDDGTFEWLDGEEQFLNGVRVTRNQGPSFYEYESKARQALLEWTMEAEPEFVLSIDADEFVGDPEFVLSAVRAKRPVSTLDMQEVWRANGRLHLRVDNLWRARLCPILWQAPPRLTWEWRIPDRQLACGREPMRVRKTRFKRSGTSVFHFGWANESERMMRAERYMVHDQGRFHQDKHLQSILWTDERVRLNTIDWPDGLHSVQDRLADLTARVLA